jgi:hypothetical protein
MVHVIGESVMKTKAGYENIKSFSERNKSIYQT